MLKKKTGILFLVSAPSGAGKTTLCTNLRMSPDFIYSISCTTRKPRQGEQDGKDYHFLTEKDFEHRIKNREFLEYATVHGNRYGTLKAPILEALDRGVDVLLDVDVQGADSVRKCGVPEIVNNLVDIFIMPPSVEELDARLRRRATETEDELRVRLTTAHGEMEQWNRYKYTLVSGSVEEDLKNFRTIMRAEQSRSSRLELGK